MLRQDGHMANPSPRVIARVRRDFPKSLVERVVGDLSTFPEALPGATPDAERIHAAILIAARGDHGTFRRQLPIVRTDWRDALMNTGLEHEDWKQVLDPPPAAQAQVVPTVYAGSMTSTPAARAALASRSSRVTNGHSYIAARTTYGASYALRLCRSFHAAIKVTSSGPV